MSSYSDSYANTNRSNDPSLNSGGSRPKMACFDQLNPKPHEFYADRSGRTVFFCALILLFVYWKLLSFSSTMITDIHSKDQYFRRELKIERENIRHQKEEFQHLLEDWQKQAQPTDLSCRRCFSSISQIDRRQIFRILDNQQHIKQEYEELLLPLQSMLICLSLLNNLVIIFIFENAIRLFLFSNFFFLLCLGIYAQWLIEDRPSVFYTLIIAVFILLFTLFLLYQVLKTFIIIRHYQAIRETRGNLSADDSHS